MDLALPYQLAGIAASLAVVLGAVLTFWLRYGKKRWAKVTRFFDRIDETINGRPAQFDAYGRETSPEIPPLAEQQATTHHQLSDLSIAVKTLVETSSELADVKHRIDALESDVVELKQARVERVMTKAEAIAAWRAIEAASGRTPPSTELPEGT